VDVVQNSSYAFYLVASVRLDAGSENYVAARVRTGWCGRREVWQDTGAQAGARLGTGSFQDQKLNRNPSDPHRPSYSDSYGRFTTPV
jgi:hypothetical protein